MTKLYTEQNYDFSWSCYDENYDGLPDADSQIIGHGDTKESAIKDYMLNKEIKELEVIFKENYCE